MSFASLLFLAGAAAVVVPILIHLIRRRKWEQVSIGSLRFLQEAAKTSRRVSQVENWPLLLLRMLMILLLALIFARPFFQDKEKVAEDAQGDTILLLDSSGSLVGSKKEMLELARKAVAKSEDDSVRVFAFADQVWSLADLDDYQAIGGAATDWEGLVAWLGETLAGGTVSKVVVVTDGREGGVSQEPERLWPTAVKTEFERIDVGEKANAAVTGVELLTEYRGEETVIEARVEVEGGWSGSAVLTLDDGRTKTVSVPQGGGRVVFVIENGAIEEAENWLRGRVGLKSKERDDWTADDTEYFCLLERVRKRVLLLDGDSGLSPFSGEGYFLSQALQASARGPGQSPFVPQIQNDFRLKAPAESEEKWDAIVLCNWPALSSEQAQILAAWNARGTGLMIALGDQVSAEGYQALQSEGMFPEGLIKQEVATPRAVGDISPQSRSMATFLDLELNLGDLFLRDGFRVGESSGWLQAASLRGGGGLLFEKEKEDAGLVLVVTHPLNREGGDFPISRWFVPLMTEWTKAVSGWSSSDQTVRQLTVGREKPELGIFENEKGIEVVNADREERKVAVLSDRELKSRLGVSLDRDQPELAEEVKWANAPQERERPYEIWPLLLILLILVGSLEIWFSDFRKSQPLRS